jgi:DNA-binding NtrC family response regulator
MANILVVDDEPLLLDLISTILRLDGHNVRAMGDPITALNFQEAGEAPIDLLVTDISLKPISGFELVTGLSKKGFNSPVLFASGYPALYWAVPDSMRDYPILEKPFTAAQLRAAVRGALACSKPKAPLASATQVITISNSISMSGTAAGG